MNEKLWEETLAFLRAEAQAETHTSERRRRLTQMADRLEYKLDPSLAVEMHTTVREIVQGVEQNGFAIVRKPRVGTNDDALLKMGAHFGDIQCHKLAEPNGVTELRGTTSAGYDDPNAREVERRLIHTDSAYINGLVRVENGYRVLAPPPLILLEMVRQANEGGESLVIDGGAILKELLLNEPRTAKALLSPDCISLVRNEMILGCPVFERLRSGYRIRYRYDALAHPEAERAVRRFEECLLDERFIHRYRLSNGEILAVDNFRMLHGREPFKASGERHLRRVLITDSSAAFLPSEKTVGTAPNRFAQYGILSSNVPNPVAVKTGIKLSEAEQHIVHSLLL